MFDLDQALLHWRKEMAEGGVDDHAILDELESHLRDEVQLQSGLDPGLAFDAAVQRIGQADALKREFAKSIGVSDRLKDALLTFAGIPNHNLVTDMNTSHVEPRWATYLKATAFLAPAIFLGLLAAVFVVPKLQQICLQAGLPTATAGTFWNLTYSSIQIMLMLLHNGVFIGAAAILLLLLLEWRFRQWPRYRRAAIGCGVFVVNTVVLFAFFMMFLAAIVAAPGLHAVSK